MIGSLVTVADGEVYAVTRPCSSPSQHPRILYLFVQCQTVLPGRRWLALKPTRAELKDPKLVQNSALVKLNYNRLGRSFPSKATT